MSSAPDAATRVLDQRLLLLDRFVVHVTSGPDAGVVQASKGAELSIGKAPANELVLSDEAVSRHHCTIVSTPRGLCVRDLGSTNGTKVDGVRVEHGYLRVRSLVGIGGTQLLVQALGEKLEEPLALEDRYGPLLGRSVAMRRLFAILPKVAASEATALIEGETGTGKGLVALALHQGGPRAAGPFVVVDCASIPPSLIESELFGHEKGSFTGAHETRIGAFEAAAGGTVFLDEIGELPIDMQPKLLRVLEEREIKRIGSTERVRIDVRVIAATNRDLRVEVNRQTFRSDLFYLLNILRFTIPPLRDRAGDIPLLLASFWEQLSGERPPRETVELFDRHGWPGNVRELRTAVERALVLGEWRFDSSVPFRVAKETALARWERRYLADLMARFEGNISRASRGARMDRNHLRELLRRYGITKHEPPVRRVASVAGEDTTETHLRSR